MANSPLDTAQLRQIDAMDELKKLAWGTEVKEDIFRRWNQGFVFSDDEPTALLQFEGGPCAVIAPIQAFLLKNLLFRESQIENWRGGISVEECEGLLCDAVCDVMQLVKSTDAYTLVHYQDGVHECTATQAKVNGEPDSHNQGHEHSSSKAQTDTSGPSELEEGTSIPKKMCLSHEEFHSELRCKNCNTPEELKNQVRKMVPALMSQHGVILVLYSLVLTKGLEQIKNEVEDPGQPLIDCIHGHGSQSLINLLITGKAVSNVWDNDKEVSGLKLPGISRQATVGFLTLLEHLRYCEVGWNLKNPQYPVWLLGSETHLSVVFSQVQSLVSAETPDAAARRMFGNFDKEGSGFISAEFLGELMGALNLVSEPEYVTIMRDKLDPEFLGIITLSSFMAEFFPAEPKADAVLTFNLYHYNGMPRSCPNGKVMYLEGQAVIMEMPELQIITDTSPIKTCLLTKWPTVELNWKDSRIPSLN